MVSSRGPQFFRKSSKHLTILDARRVRRIKFNEGPKILGATVQKLFVRDLCNSDLDCTFYKSYYSFNYDSFNDAISSDNTKSRIKRRLVNNE
jgi:hypothetical protein